MAQLHEILKTLTDEERRVVQDFAEFLIARRAAKQAPLTATATAHAISFEGWAGCLAHVHPEMSDAEFKKLIRDEWVRAALD